MRQTWTQKRADICLLWCGNNAKLLSSGIIFILSDLNMSWGSRPPSAPEQPALAEREAPWRQTSPDPL